MIQRILALAMLLTVFLMMSPATSLAWDPFGGGATNCNDPKQTKSAVCNSSKTDPIAGEFGILGKLTNLTAFIAGIAAIIMIIVSGINFMTSSGDAQKIASARSSLINAIIGLVVIVVARSLIIFVIAKL